MRVHVALFVDGLTGDCSVQGVTKVTKVIFPLMTDVVDLTNEKTYSPSTYVQ